MKFVLPVAVTEILPVVPHGADAAFVAVITIVLPAHTSTGPGAGVGEESPLLQDEKFAMQIVSKIRVMELTDFLFINTFFKSIAVTEQVVACIKKKSRNAALFLQLFYAIIFSFLKGYILNLTAKRLNIILHFLHQHLPREYQRMVLQAQKNRGLFFSQYLQID